MSRNPSSSKQSSNVPNMHSTGIYRAARMEGKVKNRGIKNAKKPSKGK